MFPSSEDTLKAEIARLTGAINRHKANPNPKSSSFPGRNNSYVNPNYNAPLKPAFTSVPAVEPTSVSAQPTRPHADASHREVVIDGVAFQSSGRSLVRKDLVKTSLSLAPKAPFKPVQSTRRDYPKPYRGSRAGQRPFKTKSSHRFPHNHNMTLANGKRPMRMGRKSIKSVKHVDKQCSRFSVTGVCPRGRICPYKHDPAKIAICWSFLQGNCSNTAETCSLSHDPTPERTPLCVHFANNGRCKNGDSCLFPHVRVGPRNGVCRDFAVLGYCEAGIGCDKQHVKECPDFAENGACSNPKCKLPHVIRANQRRVPQSSTTASNGVVPSLAAPTAQSEQDSSAAKLRGTPELLSRTDAKIGDEYISLTFHESDESEDDDEDTDDGEESEEEITPTGADSMEVHI
ncbi:hypothetical protein M0805_006896 [Coniferiporia weirii]|nr:hypothetical protein M0805_006896 [Coniferiporia weirii]